MAELTGAEQVLVDATEEQFRAATTVALERMQFMRQLGVTFGGARDLYSIFGYDREVTVKQYRDRYARGGIAKPLVDALPSAAWRLGGELIEEDDPDTVTEFETAWEAFNDRLKVWSVFQTAHVLARIGTYSIILIGAPGDDFSQELPRSARPDGSQILYLQPYLGGDLTGKSASLGTATFDCAVIDSWDEDPTSPRFGWPKTYRIKRASFGSVDLAMKPIHWSRVIHIAESTLENPVFGAPALEPVWNLLDDLDKVRGGGAEAFFLRANQGMQFDVDKDVKDLSEDAKKDLREQIENYKNSISRMIRTRGVKVKALGSDVADFNSSCDAILTQIAGTARIPKRILVGSEMGELASTQDRDNWKDRVTGSQTEFCEPHVVKRLVDRLIDYGYLPKPKQYKASWPVIETLTEQEKVDGAKGWASVNQTQGSPVFTEAEIRDKWYGLPPLEPDQIAEEQSRKPQPVVPGQNTGMTEDPHNDEGANPLLAAAQEKEALVRALALAIEQHDAEGVLELLRA